MRQYSQKSQRSIFCEYFLRSLPVYTCIILGTTFDKSDLYGTIATGRDLKIPWTRR